MEPLAILTVRGDLVLTGMERGAAREEPARRGGKINRRTAADSETQVASGRAQGRTLDQTQGSNAAPTPGGKKPDARVKLQIDLPGGKRIGPGKIQLLELIETEGSLSRAAEAMGISYRRAWVFMQQVNDAFDEPAISTPEHGHGGAAARLTDFGRQLIARFRELEDAANSDGSRFLKWLARHEQAEQSKE